MTARILSSIASISASQWDALNAARNPFSSHAFLRALEQTGCVGGNSGWRAQHLVLEDSSGQLQAAMPLYLKSHSWGEFVFDWSWAKAYSQAGLNYYPKLVSMTPFTPATGSRLLVGAGDDAESRRHALVAALIAHAQHLNVSSAHLLFIAEADRKALETADLLWRKDCQFHWHNQHYSSFAAYLATFRSDKRKKALRERRRIAEAGITFRTLSGRDMDSELWRVVFGFSAATFASRGHEHYLNVPFFRAVSAAIPEAVMIKLAMRGEDPLAAAIFFRSEDTLYGRYWGAAAEFHSLHFETCYYQGIEYCIEQGLKSFEPGTQGEHKVARGFTPTATWSAHWISEPRFRRAIGHYLAAERAAIDEYMSQVEAHVPFHRHPIGGDPLGVDPSVELDVAVGKIDTGDIDVER
jgi:predicted N-acyltransferase